MAYHSALLVTISILLIFAISGRLLTTTFLSDEESEVCEQTYGFMPCTHTALGNLFLSLVYGYLMYLAATYLFVGSELILEVLGPGLVAGLLLPSLGALPEVILILVSGLSGSVKVAQEQVSVGMGLLAGSTIMLMTAIWGACITFGKCDIENSVAVDNQDTKGFNLVASGVSTDIWTSYSAMIMVVSVLPFAVVQFPQIMHSDSGRHLAVLLGLILSISLLIAYCAYQVIQPRLQRRRLAFAKHRHLRSIILKFLKRFALGRLVDDHGKPNLDILAKLFRAMDADNDARLSRSELKAILVGMQLNEINLNMDDAAAELMKAFDASEKNEVELEDFVVGVGKWLEEAKGSRVDAHIARSNTMKYVHDYYEETKREHYLLGDYEEERVDDPRGTSIKAVLYLLLGTFIAAAFADPLVGAVGGFSTATSIPSFLISFIFLPLATNSGVAVSATTFVSRKNRRSASLTFSELYGAVTMNNFLSLSVFLALVYMRGLTWDFSSEVLVILIVCTVMGIFGSLRITFPLWTSFVAFALYPFSLILVYVLDYVFGWS